MAIDGQFAALLGFGAAAWKTAPRDRFIGWSDAERRDHMHRIVNNARFLILPSRRIRFLTRDQAMVLLRELPPHLRAMAAFSLATGLRRANVTGLTWEQVDLSRRLAWVHPDQARGRKAIGVPLNDTALAILQAEAGKHPDRVFTYEGRPVFQVSSMAWYKALKRAGIENFRWHDLRHTWASWHVQQGTPLFALQEMAGWETEKIVRRYAHLAAGHLAVYADALKIHGTILAQLPAPEETLDP